MNSECFFFIVKVKTKNTRILLDTIATRHYARNHHAKCIDFVFQLYTKLMVYETQVTTFLLWFFIWNENKQYFTLLLFQEVRRKYLCLQNYF